MRTYVRENEQIWNKQFPAVSSHDLHRENKTVAKKFCQLISATLQLHTSVTEQAIKSI